MERLKRIKEQLIGCVEYELGKGIQCVDTEELGEAIDMIKDIEEAIYYCTKTKRMDEEENYGMKMEPAPYGAPNRTYPRVPNHPSAPVNPYPMPMGGAKMGHHEEEKWDELEGHSGKCRKEYLEAKRTNMDSEFHKKKLETYVKELGRDILEMIEESTPEEKQVIQQKLSVLSNKLK